MALDDRYNPTTNSFFREMLEDQGYDPVAITPRPLNRPDNGAEAGLVFSRDRNNLILVLHQNMGTGVLEHKKEIGEEVRFLGPIVEGVEFSSQLAYKFQDDLATLRDESKDQVVKYLCGKEFVTISPGKPGRFHGYHNLDKLNPVALRITKRFS